MNLQLALWLLRHACPGDHDALAGDIVERFREGQTRRWLWRQVLIACAVGLRAEMRQHWPRVCYALAGTTLILWNTSVLRPLAGWLHWNDLPWPLSQLAFELSRPALLSLAALPILALERSFRWTHLLQTAAINLALLMLGHFLPDCCPWLFRPVPGYHLRRLIIPDTIQILLLFSNFLVSAWVGCNAPRISPSQTMIAAAPTAE